MDLACIWSRRVIDARRLFNEVFFFYHFIKLIYYHPTSEDQAKLVKAGRLFPSIQSNLRGTR